MRILAGANETLLFLNGLAVPRPLRLSEHVELRPAERSPEAESIIKVARDEIDLGVMTIFLRSVSSQLSVRAATPKETAIRAWNSLWDVVPLMTITNYWLRGLSNAPARMLDDAEAIWIEQHFEHARTLLEEEAFRSAVHALAPYRWHSHPRAQLALLWSGIEGLFGVESELAFRVSLYAARFLALGDASERTQIFDSVRRLYKLRSAAVHGARMKGDARDAVEESAQLTLRLLRQCVLANHMPRIDELVP